MIGVLTERRDIRQTSRAFRGQTRQGAPLEWRNPAGTSGLPEIFQGFLEKPPNGIEAGRRPGLEP